MNRIVTHTSTGAASTLTQEQSNTLRKAMIARRERHVVGLKDQPKGAEGNKKPKAASPPSPRK